MAILAITPSATPPRATAAHPGTWSFTAGSPNAWSSTASMRDARYSHTATLLPDGRVLVAGGYSASYHPLASAELYNPRTGAWTQTSPMHDARAGHAAALLPDGRVLVVGGHSASYDPLASAELNNPRTDRWQLTAPLHAVCSCTATTLPNGQVLVVGEATGSGAELYNPLTSTWTPTSPMITRRATITRRAQHTATLLSNGTVLVAGGYNASTGTGGILDRAEIYNPRTGRWSATGNMLAEREGHAATLLPNGRVLVTGGHTWNPNSNPPYGGNPGLSSAELYNPRTGRWSPTGSMQQQRSSGGASNPSLTLLNTGQVLVAGGLARGVGYLASAELYDPRTGLWALTAAMPEAHGSATATLLRDGRVLVVGGSGPSGTLASISVTLYTPGPSALTNLGPRVLDVGKVPLRTHGPAHAITLSSVGLRALVVSRITVAGRNPEDFAVSDTCIGVTIPPGRTCTVRVRFTPTGEGYRYATVTIVDNAPDSPHSISVYGIGYRAGPNTWALTGNMLGPLSGHSATLLHTGHVLVLGGPVDPMDATMGASSAAQLYDPRTGRWAATGSMHDGRLDPAVALLPNGQVLVAGSSVEFCGSHESYCPSLSSAELYDPNTGEWTPTGSMTTGRGGATATVLRDGQVLVTGGVDDPGTPPTSAELYDPRTGRWTATGAMTTARSGYTATLLPNGKVLVAGGHGSKGTLASAELYDPRTGRWTATRNMTTARAGHTATLLRNGRVLVTGGNIHTVTCAPHYRSTTELYDPRTGRWRPAAPMLGGAVPVRLYDPRHGTWKTSCMMTVWDYGTATLLRNGQVLVTGGDVYPRRGTELYDPRTGRWRGAAPMLVARAGHTATLLPNGQVLVAGGDNRGTAEVYTP